MSSSTVQTSAVDPVTRYARSVVAGEVVAGRLVRLACERHLADLAAGPGRGLEWRPAEAQRVIEFFPKILQLPEEVDGGDDDDVDETPAGGDAPRPFVLSPFQQFIAGSLFGWYTARNRRRFRFAYIETGKGSGKTPFVAGLAIYRTVADGERNAQGFFAATKLDQARIPFRDAEKMVDGSPSLRKRCEMTRDNLAFPAFGSFIRAIASEKKGLDGWRVSTGVIEELHEHATPTVVQKIRKGMKGRRNALMLEPTNAGFDRNSICWAHHELSRQVLEGRAVNDAWFAFIAQLDPCAACRAQGHEFPQDTCSACDDWRVEGPHWLKANPNLGVSLPWSSLREEVRIAIAVPSEQSMTKRLNFGIWTDQVTVWIPGDQWEMCRAPAVRVATPATREAFMRSLEGRECFVGGDLSEKIDLAAMVFLFPRPLSQHIERADGEALARAIDVVSFFWMPEKTLTQRAKEDNIPYPDWREQGYITATPGRLIDHDAIADFLIAEIARRRWRVRGIGVDQASATAFVTRLTRHFGDELVTEVPQGFRTLGAPSKTLEALVLSRELAHDGNPVMTMCVGNMGKEENHWREIRPVKLAQRKRIDGGVALIDGIFMMEKDGDGSTSAYDDGHGLMVC